LFNPIYNVEASEVGGTITYSRFLSDHWTLGLSGSYFASRMATTGSSSQEVCKRPQAATL
jgi:hypothetical protein